MSSIDQSPPAGEAAPKLMIRVSGGSGAGQTMLAAFDAALRSAGVGNFNLVRLSSVIPPGSEVVEARPDGQLVGGFGDRLFCVYASGWATAPGSDVWSGVAWSRHRDGSGAGLFVEHSGPTEAEVRGYLVATLDDMSRGRGNEFAYEDAVLSHAQCAGPAACALVIATYRSMGWE